MFGNRTLSKAIVKVSEEGAKQHQVVAAEIDKLCEITAQRWDLVSGVVFDKVRKISFGEGFICGTAFTGLAAAAHKIVKKRKEETDEEK